MLLALIPKHILTQKIYKINISGKECLANRIRTLTDYTETINVIIEDAKAVIN